MTVEGNEPLTVGGRAFDSRGKRAFDSRGKGAFDSREDGEENRTVSCQSNLLQIKARYPKEKGKQQQQKQNKTKIKKNEKLANTVHCYAVFLL